jgi:hypothetical protein
MKQASLTILLIFGLSLAGCGSTNDSPSRDEAQPQHTDQLEAGQDDPMHHGDLMPAGAWETYSSTGAYIIMQIPADPNDEPLTEIDEYREAVEADPVTYLEADVDNRQGTDSVNMWKVRAFDQAGNSYEFNGVAEYVSDIAPSTDWDVDDGSYLLPNGTRLDREQGSELYSQSIDLHNEHLHGTSAAERKTMILVYDGDDLPDEFTRVAVFPNGATEEVDAYPID